MRQLLLKGFLQRFYEIMKKKIRGTSDTCSTKRLAHQTQWPSVLYWRLTDFTGSTESWFFSVYCLFCLNFFLQITESWLKPVCFESTTMAIFGSVCPFKYTWANSSNSSIHFSYSFLALIKLTTNSFILNHTHTIANYFGLLRKSRNYFVRFDNILWYWPNVEK